MSFLIIMIGSIMMAILTSPTLSQLFKQTEFGSIITSIYSPSDPIGVMLTFENKTFLVIEPGTGIIKDQSHQQILNQEWGKLMGLRYYQATASFVAYSQKNNSYRYIRQKESDILDDVQLSLPRQIKEEFEIKLMSGSNSNNSHFLLDGGDLIRVDINASKLAIKILNTKNTRDALLFTNKGYTMLAICEETQPLTYMINLYNDSSFTVPFRRVNGTEDCLLMIPQYGSTVFLRFANDSFFKGDLLTANFHKIDMIYPVGQSPFIAANFLKDGLFIARTNGTDLLVVEGRKSSDTVAIPSIISKEIHLTFSGDPWPIMLSSFSDNTTSFEGLTMFGGSTLVFFETYHYCWKKDYTTFDNYCEGCYAYFNPVRCNGCYSGYSLISDPKPGSECYLDGDECPLKEFRSYLDDTCYKCSNKEKTQELIANCSYEYNGTYIHACEEELAFLNNTRKCQRKCQAQEYVDGDNICQLCNVQLCDECWNWTRVQPACKICQEGFEVIYSSDELSECKKITCLEGQALQSNWTCEYCGDINAASCNPNSLNETFECKQGFLLDFENICTQHIPIIKMEIRDNDQKLILANFEEGLSSPLTKSQISFDPITLTSSVYLTITEITPSSSYYISLKPSSSLSLPQNLSLSISGVFSASSSRYAPAKVFLSWTSAPSIFKIDNQKLQSMAEITGASAQVVEALSILYIPFTDLVMDVNSLKIYGLVNFKFTPVFDAGFRIFGKIKNGYFSRMIAEAVYGESYEKKGFFAKEINPYYGFYAVLYQNFVTAFIVKIVGTLAFVTCNILGAKKGISKFVFKVLFSNTISSLELHLLVIGVNLKVSKKGDQMLMILLDLMISIAVILRIGVTLIKKKTEKLKETDRIIMEILRSKATIRPNKEDRFLEIYDIPLTLTRPLIWVLLGPYPLICLLVLGLIPIARLTLLFTLKEPGHHLRYLPCYLLRISDSILPPLLISLHLTSPSPSVLLSFLALSSVLISLISSGFSLLFSMIFACFERHSSSLSHPKNQWEKGLLLGWLRQRMADKARNSSLSGEKRKKRRGLAPDSDREKERKKWSQLRYWSNRKKVADAPLQKSEAKREKEGAGTGKRGGRKVESGSKIGESGRIVRRFATNGKSLNR